jgi:hypothetical protein
MATRKTKVKVEIAYAKRERESRETLDTGTRRVIVRRRTRMKLSSYMPTTVVGMWVDVDGDIKSRRYSTDKVSQKIKFVYYL